MPDAQTQSWPWGQIDELTPQNTLPSQDGVPATFPVPGAVKPTLPSALHLPPAPPFDNGDMEAPRPPAITGSSSHDPPPPPPPPPAFSPRLALPHPEAFRHRYGEPDDIVERHENLQDSRENLMGTRFRLQAKREGVRMLREQTGEKEGHAISQLRQFLHKLDITLPREVEQAWEQVHASRDRLGMLEAEYDEVEERYHDEEIKYTREESSFVDNLLTRGATPPPDRDVKPFPLTNQAIDERYSGIPFQPAETRAQVDQWLFEIMEDSRFEKAQLRAINAPGNMDDGDWWELVKKTWNFWNLDSSAATQLHAGDSTFSQGAGTQPPSDADLVSGEPEGIDLKDPIPGNLLPQDKVLDATEAPNFAQSIKSGDILEPDGVPSPTQHEPNNDDTNRSVSTDMSHVNGTFSGDELASITTIDQTCSCFNCSNHQTHPMRFANQTQYPTSIDRQTAYSPLRQGRSPLSTPRQNTADLTRAHNESFLPVPRLATPNPSATPESLIPERPTELVEGDESAQHDPVSKADDQTPRLKPYDTSTSPCPSLDASRSSTLDGRSSDGSVGTPSSRIYQPKAFLQHVFPFLTPAQHSISQENDHTDKSNPTVVDISDSTLRLPGPTPDEL